MRGPRWRHGSYSGYIPINQRCQWCLFSLGNWKSLGISSIRNYMCKECFFFFSDLCCLLEERLVVWNPSTSIHCGNHCCMNETTFDTQSRGCNEDLLTPNSQYGHVNCSLLVGWLVGPWTAVNRGQNGYCDQWSWRVKPGTDQMAPWRRIHFRVFNGITGGHHCIHAWCLEKYPAWNYQFAPAKESSK